MLGAARGCNLRCVVIWLQLGSPVPLRHHPQTINRTSGQACRGARREGQRSAARLDGSAGRLLKQPLVVMLAAAAAAAHGAVLGVAPSHRLAARRCWPLNLADRPSLRGRPPRLIAALKHSTRPAHAGTLRRPISTLDSRALRLRVHHLGRGYGLVSQPDVARAAESNTQPVARFGAVDPSSCSASV